VAVVAAAGIVSAVAGIGDNAGPTAIIPALYVVYSIPIADV
jgi:hypothetical protein